MAEYIEEKMDDLIESGIKQMVEGLDTLTIFEDLNLEQKKEQLIFWAQNYYEGNEKVPDKTFDIAYKMYINEGGKDLGIGFGYEIPGEESFIHYCYPVGSLENIFINNVDKAFDKDLQVEVTPKLDGGSCVIYYGDDGKLIRALTRGDKGKKGIDITKNLIHIIPLKIPNGPFAIRGEVCMTWESFDKINKTPGKGHPRNKASGLAGSKNSDQNEINHLKFIAYDILNTDKLKSDILILLKNFGFLTPSSWYGTFKDFINVLENATLFNKDSGFFKIGITFKEDIKNESLWYLENLPYDGIVIANNEKRNKVFSDCEWPFYISPSKAFKFEDEKFETTIIDIEWNMSNLGRYKPVAILEPTNIDGTIVKRASLNNAQYIIDHEYGKGAKVLIVKACSIMPEIVEGIVHSIDFTLPQKCEFCNSPTIFSGRELVCSSNDCIYNELAMVSNLLNEYKVKGIGDKILENFIDNFRINNIEELKNLFNKDLDYLYEHLLFLGVSTSRKMMDTINIINSSKPNLAAIIRISNINGIGETSLDNISSRIDSDEFIEFIENETNGKIYNKTNGKIYEELKIACSSEPAFENLINSTKNILRVLEFFNFEITNDFKLNKDLQITNINYCLTGTLSKPRKELIEDLKMLGAKFTSISKADVLIADSPSSKNKYQTALKRGIEIITEEEFFKKLKGDN